MDSVGDERGAEGVLGHLGDDGVSVAVEEAGAAVTEVGGEEGAGAEGFLDVVAGGHGMAEGGDDVVVGEIFDERDGSLGFGREGDHGDATARGFLEGLECGAVGGLDRIERVGASSPVLGTDERAFEVEAGDLGAVGQSSGQEGELMEEGLKEGGLGRDEGGEHDRAAGFFQAGEGVSDVLGSGLCVVKIATGEAVDLNVAEAGAVDRQLV